jgi:hypothetical protein
MLKHLRPEDMSWSELRWIEILKQALHSQDHDSIMRAAEFAVYHQGHAAETVAAWKDVAERLEAFGEPAGGLPLLYVANEVVHALAHQMASPG